MPQHIRPYNNKNQAIIDKENSLVPRIYLNVVRLNEGESFSFSLVDYETVCVLAEGSCTIAAGDRLFEKVGQRKSLWDGKPDSVYVPRGKKTTIRCLSPRAEIYIAGAKTQGLSEAFRVSPNEVDTVQYGSDETKTHRKIHHIIGQNNAGKVRGNLLLSELFTVGAGGWSGFPPHKHDVDREGETAFEEVYYFRFDPSQGFGAQFTYVEEEDFGPVHHIKDASTIVLDKGYHPVVAAPGYRMYYFTILVGKTSHSLQQSFEKKHAYQLETIPGIKDMIRKFK